MPAHDFQQLRHYLIFKLLGPDSASNLSVNLDFESFTPDSTELTVDVRGYHAALRVAEALGQLSAKFTLHEAYEPTRSSTEMTNPDRLPDLVTYRNASALDHFTPVIREFQALWHDNSQINDDFFK